MEASSLNRPEFIEKIPKMDVGGSCNPVNLEFTPRQYQVELFEESCRRNVIICLETGAGKTFIATMLIKELSWQVRGEFGLGSTGKRTFFLARTVPLAEQQARYLQMHTSLRIKHYIGSMNVDVWDRVKWRAELSSTQVFVMTPQILVDMLAHAYITMENINLLVFDECHHAVGNHPFRVIMRSFIGLKHGDRPRVLGLTGCLFNGKITPSKLEKKVTDLECTLFSAVVTSIYDISKYSTAPKEELIVAPTRPKTNFETRMGLKLQDFYREMGRILPEMARGDVGFVEDKPRDASLSVEDLGHCLQTLGVYGLFHLSSLILEDNEQREMLKTEYSLSLLTEIRNDTASYVDSLSDTICSPKLKKLMRLLEAFLGQFGDDFCGIIFVERRYTATIIERALEFFKPFVEQLKHVRCEHVIGQSTRPELLRESKMTAKQQIDAMARFRSGQSNLLIATNIVEEGIDVPQCNFVCKFDRPMDFRSYVQSKGRARAKPSFYFVLLDEESEGDYLADLNNYKDTEAFIKDFKHGRLLPSERQSEESFDDGVAVPEYAPFPGASSPRVTMYSAVPLVHKYCGKLPSDQYCSLTPTCDIRQVSGGLYVATITLPSNSVLKTPVSGTGWPTISAAKASAAIATCKLLHQLKELDDNLLPVSDEPYKEMAEMQLKIPSGGSWYKKTVPCAFSGPLRGQSKRLLYAINQVLIDPSFSELPTFVTSSYKFGVLLSDHVNLPDFLIYSHFGTENIRLSFVREVLISEEDILRMVHFSEYIFSTLLKLKNFELDRTRYEIDAFLVYLDELGELVSPYEIAESEQDAVVTVSHAPGAEYFVIGVSENETASSPFVKPEFDSYGHYFSSKYRVQVDDWHQPLVLCKQVPKRLNFHVKTKPTSDAKPATQFFPKYLQQLCKRKRYSAHLLYRAQCIPSILHRIFSLLNAESLARDALACLIDESRLSRRKQFKFHTFVPSPYREDLTRVLLSQTQIADETTLGPHPAEVLRSITLKNAHSGEGFDLERNEILGDAFLKFSLSTALFCQYPEQDEGKLTVRKNRLLSNAYLANISLEKGLQHIIVSQNFSVKENWLPPRVTECANDPRSHHQLFGKSLADVVEALIGCFHQRMGVQPTLTFMHKWLHLPVLPESGRYFPPPCSTIVPTQDRHSVTRLLSGLGEFERSLGYIFRDKLYLLQAFTHSSYSKNRVTDNYQRLEFLGDALLDYLVTKHIFKACDLLSPGNLTRLRSALVNNVLFSSLAVRHGFHRHLLHLAPLLYSQIQDYIQVLKSYAKTGEESAVVTFSDDLFKSENPPVLVEDPKPLGDIFESVAGAIFLDSGFNLDTVWGVYYPMLADVIQRYSKNIPISPVSQIFEAFPEKVVFKALESTSEAISVIELTVSGHGSFIGRAPNSKTAKRAAAKIALKALCS